LADHIPNCPQNADDVVNDGDNKRSFSFIRQVYRPKDQALLLIYPINPNSESKEYPKGALEVAPIKTSEVLWGITFVFPEESNLSTGRYIVNSTV